MYFASYCLASFLLQWDPNEIRNRRMPVVLDVKQSNFSVTTTSTTTEEAIKDTSTASDKTIDSLYHSPGHVRVDQNEHSEHVHHSHQSMDFYLVGSHAIHVAQTSKCQKRWKNSSKFAYILAN